MDRELGHGKMFFFRYHLYQKKMTMFKKDDRPSHQKSRFFIASKEVGLS